MSEWTREHDAHIARECEGWEIWEGDLKELFGAPKGQPEKWRRVPSYTTDANARDRAAEAWRKKGRGREYLTHSRVQHGKAIIPPRAVVWPFTTPSVEVSGPHALLWALYRATRGEK